MTTASTKRRRKQADSPNLKWEIKPSLIIRGFRVAPEEITRLLGVSPTQTWMLGDPVGSSSLVRRKDNAWRLAAPSPHTEPLSRQLELLLAEIAPATERFGRLPQGSSVQLFCAIYDYERSAVIHFPQTAVRALAGIGADIAIDYYDLSEDT